MKRIAFLTVLVAFGLILFSGCASLTGETAGENIDDSMITTKANAIIVRDPELNYLKIDVTTITRKCCAYGFCA